jgi:hypothetical protein
MGDEKVTVRIGGTATMRWCREIVMTRYEFEEYSAGLDGARGWEYDDLSLEYFDPDSGDFDSAEIDELAIIGHPVEEV